MFCTAYFGIICLPDGGGNPEGVIAEQIDKDFGSFEAFKKHFSSATAAVEGSGWGILAWNPYTEKIRDHDN